MIFVINTTESNSNLQLFSIKMEIIIKSDLIQQKKNLISKQMNLEQKKTNKEWQQIIYGLYM